jgi:hypothetical protein
LTPGDSGKLLLNNNIALPDFINKLGQFESDEFLFVSKDSESIDF